MLKFIAVVAISCLLSMPGMAAGIDITKIPKVAKYQTDQKKFEAATKEVEQVAPYDDELMSYSLRLPKRWTNNIQTPPGEREGTSLQVSETVLGILGKYIGAPKNLQRSSLVVEGQGLAYEVSAMNWFINFILLNGFSLTAMTEISSKEIVALYVQVEGDQTFVVRTRVVINGNRLVMVRYYLPQENYNEEKGEQAQIVDSFKLLKPSEDSIEKHETYGFLDQSYFSYPESWKLKERSILSIERMSALLYQERKDGRASVLEGHIKINVISRLLNTTAAQEVAEFRKNLKIKDYSVGVMLENVKYNFDPSIKTGSAQVYKLNAADPVNMKSYEILVAVLQGEDYYYITSMITPSREQDFYSWARNMEAAKIINESMRRNNIRLEYDPNDPYFDYMKGAQ